MILDVPEIYYETGYYEGLSLILWYVTIAILFSCCGLFHFFASKKELKEARAGYIAYGLFMMFFGLTQVFYLLRYYNGEQYELLTGFAWMFAVIALMFIIYVLESQVLKSEKHIILIIESVAIAICFIAIFGFLDHGTAVALVNAIAMVAVAAVCILFLYIIAKSQGRVRTKASLIFIGTLIIYIAELINAVYFITAFPEFPMELIPIIMSMGAILFTCFHLFYKV